MLTLVLQVLLFDSRVLPQGAPREGLAHAATLPDLLITASSTTGAAADQPTELSITIRNQGSANAGRVHLHVMADLPRPPSPNDPSLVHLGGPPLPAGAAVTLTAIVPAGRLSPGRHTLLVVVDAHDAVRESDEPNNVATMEILLAGPGPMPGGALLLEGTSSFVEVPDSPDLRVPVGLTLEAWVKPDAAGGHHHLTGKHGYELAVEPAGAGFKAVWDLSIGGTWRAVSSAGLPLGAWHHLAGTYDGSVMRLFVDGRLVASRAVAGQIDQTTDPFRIGTVDANGDFLDGAIDEVRLSGAVRYSGDFAPARTPFVSDGDTRGLWHLDEGEGTTTADASGNGHTGALVNGPTWTGDSPLAVGIATPTPTVTSTPTATATRTQTPTPTAVPTDTPTETPAATATVTPTQTATPTPPPASGPIDVTIRESITVADNTNTSAPAGVQVVEVIRATDGTSAVLSADVVVSEPVLVVDSPATSQPATVAVGEIVSVQDAEATSSPALIRVTESFTVGD